MSYLYLLLHLSHITNLGLTDDIGVITSVVASLSILPKKYKKKNQGLDKKLLVDYSNEDDVFDEINDDENYE